MFRYRRRLHRTSFTRRSRLLTIVHWTIRVGLILLLVDLFYLSATWPDWKRLSAGPVPKSAFMVHYEARRSKDRQLPALRWQPVALSDMPKFLQRAVILAEDSRFYEHSGFDLIAFREAMDYNLQEGRLALGASTISQQTVKNLFLSPARNPLRKWHELILTWGMERELRKRRILEIYLNIAEFGEGLYGIEAAALSYYGVPVSRITPRQAAELAATLPGPTKNNPATRTPAFEKRTQRILGLLERFPGDAAESLPPRPTAPAPSRTDASAQQV